jgi:hypothetical protein
VTARRRRAAGAAAGAVAAALTALAACGASPAGVSATPTGAGPAPAALPLALSLVDAGGTSWAVIEMGGGSAQEENFWQVFVRPAAAGGWHLATPAGVADNGGLVIASTGAGALLAGFRPSQDLTFSPLAATADGGARWIPGGPLSPGLSDVPGALAAGPGAQLIALTGGGAELSHGAGTRWTRLASTRGLAATAAGRACGLTSVTAAAVTAGGGPLLGGACGRPGVAGIFARPGGAWQPAGPDLPPALAGGPVQVLRLGSAASVAGAGSGNVALLAVGHGAAAGVVAAWSGDGGSQWQLSPVLRTAGRRVRSASLWPDGSAGLVLSGPRGGSGAVIGGPGAAWAVLPALPAGTATLARGAGGAIEALTAARATMGAWRLSAAVAGWTEFQQVRVSIPYGSSG